MKNIKHLLSVIVILTLFFISQGYAQTWSGTKRLTWTSYLSFGAEIVRDTTGTIFVFWSGGPSLYGDIYHKFSTNNGTTWSSPNRVTWNSGGSYNPSVVIDSSNNIHLFWHDFTPGKAEIFYKKSTDGGINWTLFKRLTWNTRDSWSPKAVIDSSGFIHVVWYEGLGSAQVYYKNSTDGGASWSATKKMTWTFGDSWHPVIAVDSNDNLHVLWEDNTSGNTELYYKKSTDSGLTWSSPKRLTYNSDWSRDVSVVIDSSDMIHIFWDDHSSGNDEIYYKNSQNSGMTWSGPKRLSWNTGGSYGPVISKDSGDNLYLFWQDSTPGNQEIFHKISQNSGTNWSSLKRLTWTSGHSRGPAALLVGTASIHLVWDNQLSITNMDIYYKRGIF